MNHAGEIAPLSGLVRPHVAIITTVEPVHLEFFDSVAAIAEAKAEIFAGLEPGGTAILNRDNAYFELLSDRARAAGAQVVSFGRHVEADVRPEEWDLGPDGSEIVVRLVSEACRLSPRRSWRTHCAEFAGGHRRAGRARRGPRCRSGGTWIAQGREGAWRTAASSRSTTAKSC